MEKGYHRERETHICTVFLQLNLLYAYGYFLSKWSVYEIGFYCHNVVFLACYGGTKTRNRSRMCPTPEANTKEKCVLEDQQSSLLEIEAHLVGSKGKLILMAVFVVST